MQTSTKADRAGDTKDNPIERKNNESVYRLDYSIITDKLSIEVRSPQEMSISKIGTNFVNTIFLIERKPSKMSLIRSSKYMAGCLKRVIYSMLTPLYFIFWYEYKYK